MKLLLGTILTLLIIVLGWLSLGWIAIIVLPFGGLVALMSFSGVIVEWEKEQASQTPATQRRAQNHVAPQPARARC